MFSGISHFGYLEMNNIEINVPWILKKQESNLPGTFRTTE